MPWYKRLRWRLVGLQFLVASVGVAIMMVATRVIILSSAPAVIRPKLIELTQDTSQLAVVEEGLIIAFRNAVLGSVGIAAVGAVVVGTISSLVLWRTLVVPLRRTALASQRVADGRYGERLPIPDNAGEALAKLSMNFNQMAAALEETEQQRITLIGNVTHELRTPLTGLKGFVEGLADGMFPPNDETFSLMELEIDRLARLVEDIQVLSRVESGALKLNFQTFDAAKVVAQTVAQARPQALAKSIALSLSEAITPIRVHADRDRTAQILINLIGNAIRYTPAGGTVTVQIIPHPEHYTAEITITDTGVGITADALPYVFERFYREDDSRSRQSGGSGVGLTISRHLAWAMGGEITAVSEGKGKGSQFTLTLPMK